jgi:hypothetical protein
MDAAPYPDGSKEPRPPRRSDIGRLCAELNRLGAKYMVVGGFAIIEAGYPRFTGDIDLLVDPSLENEALVFQALRSLPDKAVDQLSAGDIARFVVVRVADEVVVDLMANSCGIDYATAMKEAVFREIDGVRIPFASPALLWKMKQTVREKDVPDRAFLRSLLDLPRDPAERRKTGLPSFLERVRRWFGR